MFRTWVHSDPDPEGLARALEAHLNEYAEEVLSVSYSVDRTHHVLAVYRGIETAGSARAEAALAEAEDIIELAE